MLPVMCIAGCIMSSCVEEYNADLPSSENNLLVVDGAILSDTTSTFCLSLSMPINSNEGPKYVNDATIQLKGTDGTCVDALSAGNGEYMIPTPKLSSDAKYNITINYDGDTYESEALAPFPSIGIKNVEANQPTDTSSVNILITTDVPANTSEIQYFKWQYKETWEVHPDFDAMYYWDPDSMVVRFDRYHFAKRGWKFDTSDEILASSSAYYGSNQIVQYKLYDIPRSDERLYVLYSTEVIQRSVTKAEYEYETERKKISTDMGGLFTPQPSALPSNIKCTTANKRVLGYVGCSLNTVRYRAFVKSGDVKISWHVAQYETISNTDARYPGEAAMYRKGWLISEYVNHPPLPESISWVEAKHVDLTKAGCSIVMPSYWPY